MPEFSGDIDNGVELTASHHSATSDGEMITLAANPDRKYLAIHMTKAPVATTRLYYEIAGDTAAPNVSPYIGLGEAAIFDKAVPLGAISVYLLSGVAAAVYEG
jgi:hypothetical protein